MADTATTAQTSATEAKKNRSYFQIAKNTVNEWIADEAFVMGAALAYFAFLALAPTLVILLKIISVYYGDDAAQGKLVSQLQTFMGPQAAQGIQDLLKNMHQSEGGVLATVLSVGMLLVSATGLVNQLKRSLNHMWNVEQKPGLGVWGFVRDRVLGLAMILGIGFILLTSMVLSAVISGMTSWIEQTLAFPPIAIRLIDVGVSAVVFTLLFAMIYKFLPDVKIAWKNVWVGAATTAVLFVFGKYLIGLYLGRSSVASGYGAAGSLVVLLIWIYYSSLILFLGAEFTQVYSRFRGAPVRPSDQAIPADSPEALAQKPKKEKAVQHSPAPGTEPSQGRAARAESRASSARPGTSPDERGDKIVVHMPPQKKRGSLVGGVLSFLAVQAAARATGKRSRKSHRAG